MVNGLQRKKSVVVKFSDLPVSEHATAKGGLCALEAFARRMGLWSLCDGLVPARKDPGQGFTSTAVVSSMVHGLLSGGRGFEATEPMRGDAPLLRLLGLERAPSAETVEGVTKYLSSVGGHDRLGEITYRQCIKSVRCEKRSALVNADGFVPVWSDGSLLEVDGRKFEAIKTMGGKRGQLVAGCYVGPYLLASDFADEGECELELSRGFLREQAKRFLNETKLMDQGLLLLDSLYGDGPTLDLLEEEFLTASHIVGANKLVETQKQMAQMSESEWIDTGANKAWGWEESAVCTFWLQCEGWTTKRLCVGRRWKAKGDMIYHYAAVVTNLSRRDERILAKIKRERLRSFEEAVWRLYDGKQGLENNWKSLLVDMGLHHPVSSKVQANAVFFAIAGLAYNLAVGFRRLTLEGDQRSMRLWRLRRDIIDMAARVTTHARNVVVQVLDARDHLVQQLRAAMLRVDRL